jgi:hypothetical protein
MSLSDDQVDKVRSASDRDLVRGASTVDLAVVVEANLRLKRATGFLTWVLIVLTAVLVVIGIVTLLKA